MIIQIYEIQSPTEADIMVELGVDHVGSVLLSEAQWHNDQLNSVVQKVQSAGLKSSLIPLFERVDTISKAIDFYQPDILHFCETLPRQTDDAENLDPIMARQQTIRDRFPQLELMRSIPIGQVDNGDRIPSLAYGALFEPLSDWFLTDTLLGGGDDMLNQPVEGFVGITGKICDWQIARELVQRSRIPVILAGGIGPDNVARGISQVMPAGVDSCTLTNALDRDGQAIRFRKDPEKVRLMIRNAHSALNGNE